jgi:ribosomal protein L7/L12
MKKLEKKLEKYPNELRKSLEDTFLNSKAEQIRLFQELSSCGLKDARDFVVDGIDSFTNND